ncbi:hypothetical protein L6164_022536 [Bauhinia variegata]|uniref:Uncharacterized protein n=1 Tax=Bauhinia variegata TaxID=167791 RepID=A0ACB9MFK0_BAUVA|nr:hypothetical protein L6164_022536 [Bauhinia variegata]
MASFSSHNWVLSLKVVLISTGVLSMAMALKVSVPVISDFVVSEAPSIWNLFLTWLRPPYLYILVNFIIITIVASSKLQNHGNESIHSSDTVPVPAVTSLPTEPVKISGDVRTEYAVYNEPKTVVLPPDPSLAPAPVKISGDVRTDYAVYNGVVSNQYVYDASVPADVLQPRILETVTNNKITNSDEAYLTPSSVKTSLERKDSLDFSFSDENEKPPVSARFGHRKAFKAIPEGGKAPLGVSKPKRQDTLESTWKTITEGRAMPLTRHLKKSDTWDSQLRRNSPLTDQNTPPNPKLMKKSETFNERSKKSKENSSPSPSPGSGKLRKETSLSHDELNRRVEAFIKKFNEEMRLQRQESLRQYQEMISRGAQ